jgi:hypothetical protein
VSFGLKLQWNCIHIFCICIINYDRAKLMVCEICLQLRNVSLQFRLLLKSPSKNYATDANLPPYIVLRFIIRIIIQSRLLEQEKGLSKELHFITEFTDSWIAYGIGFPLKLSWKSVILSFGWLRTRMRMRLPRSSNKEQ